MIPSRHEPEIKVFKVKSLIDLSDPQIAAALERERKAYEALNEAMKKMVDDYWANINRLFLYGEKSEPGIRDIPSDLMNPDGAF